MAGMESVQAVSRKPTSAVPQDTQPRHDLYIGVQILRGLAALVVMLQHDSVAMAERAYDSSLRFDCGQCGVDIFFAISGFVMVLVTAGIWGRAGTAEPFLVRRLIRVVPLYWLFTAFKVLLLLVLPALAISTVLTPWHVISSFLFIPDSTLGPVVFAGWTLSFEMLFYVLFTGALSLRVRQPVLWLAGLLTALVLVGMCRTESWNESWTATTKLLDPLLLEFVFGMLIGVAALNRRVLPFRLALALAVLCVAALLSTEVLGNDARAIRLFVWGIPAALLLRSVVSLEDWLRSRPVQWLVVLGAWSYSLYLSHGFVVDFAWVAAAKLHLAHGLLIYVIYAAAFCACIAAAGVIHRTIELPMTRALNRKYRKAAAAQDSSQRTVAALATN
jgi:exopolysaccharide production protein ExoZ